MKEGQHAIFTKSKANVYPLPILLEDYHVVLSAQLFSKYWNFKQNFTTFCARENKALSDIQKSANKNEKPKIQV
jgi:hypothetical protein